MRWRSRRIGACEAAGESRRKQEKARESKRNSGRLGEASGRIGHSFQSANHNSAAFIVGAFEKMDHPAFQTARNIAGVVTLLSMAIYQLWHKRPDRLSSTPKPPKKSKRNSYLDQRASGSAFSTAPWSGQALHQIGQP